MGDVKFHILVLVLIRKKQTVQKPTLVDRCSLHQGVRNNNAEGTLQNNSVTSEEGVPPDGGDTELRIATV